MASAKAAKTIDRTQVQQKQDARRSDVARAALSVIGKEGLDGMSMRAIAAEMGCSTGVLTHYFRDKVELVRFVLEWMNDDLMSAFNGRAPTSLDDLVDRIMLVLPHDPSKRVRWRGFLNFTVASLNEPSLAGDESRRNKTMATWLKATLQAMVADGVLDPTVNAELESKSLLALVDGLGMHALLTPSQYPKSKVRDHLHRHLLPLTRRAPI